MLIKNTSGFIGNHTDLPSSSGLRCLVAVCLHVEVRLEFSNSGRLRLPSTCPSPMGHTCPSPMGHTCPMGFTVSDTASDVSYLVLQESLPCRLGWGGEQHMKLTNEAKLACVVSMTTENKSGYKLEMQQVNKYISVEKYKLQLEKEGWKLRKQRVNETVRFGK